MATAFREATSPFVESDLKYLHEALYPVRSKSKSFGLQIGLLLSDIEAIEIEQSDLGNQLLEILSLRLDKSQPFTWNEVDKALRSDCIGQSSLADSIRKKFFSTNPSFEEIRPSSSETDDSSETDEFSETDGSPSTAEILTKSQSNKLKKIFKRSFGQLCCLSFDPVQTAAHLQKRGLISTKVMMDMIKSPESQQTNIVSLVCAIDKKIKKRPECLFQLIRVFLESDVLHNEGKEMLRYASKEQCNQYLLHVVLLRVTNAYR